MNALDVLRDPVWQRVALVLLHFVWQGAAVALVLAAAMWLLRVRRPQVRYALGLGGLAMMAACPIVTFVLVEPAAGGAPAAHVVERHAGPEIEGGPERALAGGSVPPVATGGLWERVARGWEQRDRFVAVVAPHLVLFWIAGVFLFGARLLTGFVGMHWIARRRREPPRDVVERAVRLAERLGLWRVPRVAICARVREAMVVGFVRPLVLLPAAWVTELPPGVLEAVLAHELAHIRRWDVWVNLGQRVIETLLFYHPAVWWVSRRVRAERELCCDDLAVRATGERMEYAQALECVAQRRLEGSSPLLAAGMGGRKMAILRRVRHVLGVQDSGGGTRAGRWTAGVIALAVPPALWVAVSVWAPPVVGQEEQAVEARQHDEERRTRRREERGELERAIREAERQALEARERAEEALRRVEESARRAMEEPKQAERKAWERFHELRRLREGEERDRPGVRGAADEREIPPFLLPEEERRRWLWNWSQEWREGQRRERERREREEREARERARERWVDEMMRREAYQRPEAERREREPEAGPARLRDYGSRKGVGPSKELAEPELVNHLLQLRREVENLKRELQEMRGSREGTPFRREPSGVREQNPFRDCGRRLPGVGAVGPGGAGAGAFGPPRPPKRPTPPEGARYPYSDGDEGREGREDERDEAHREDRGVRPPSPPRPPDRPRVRTEREERRDGDRRDGERRDETRDAEEVRREPTAGPDAILAVHVYPVADLVTTRDGEADFDWIVDRLERTFFLGSGVQGSVRTYPTTMSLVIRATPAVHAEIARELEGMRQSPDRTRVRDEGERHGEELRERAREKSREGGSGEQEKEGASESAKARFLESLPIVEIRIQGLENVPRSELETVIRVRPGHLASPDRIREDLKRLYATRRFASIEPRLERRGDGVRLTYVVVERPAGEEVRIPGMMPVVLPPEGEPIAGVAIRGSSVVPEGTLKKLIDIRPGDRITAEQLNSEMQKLLKMGWFIGVGQDLESSAEGPILVYSVLEDPELRKSNETKDSTDRAPSRAPGKSEREEASRARE